MGKEQLGDPVGEPFTIKGLFPTTSKVETALGFALVVVVGIVTAAMPKYGHLAIWAILPGLAMLVTGVVGLFVKRPRWQVALFEQGASIGYPGGGRIEVLFAELAALSHNPVPHYANGIYAGVTHRLRLWRKEDHPKCPFVDLHCYLSAKKQEAQSQAMQAFANAASAAIGERLASVLANGGTAKSPSGLQLDASGLRYKGTALPLENIANIEVYDGKFCVWEKGKEFATLRLDPAEANVLPIMDLAHKRLTAQPQEEAQPPEGSLGRVLFERRRSKVVGWALVVMGALLIGIGLPFIVWGVYLLRGYFRCHERGVSQRGLGQEKRLLYNEVAVFTYSATRLYVNGVYSGTNLVMKFTSENPKALPTIKLSTSLSKTDEDLDALRDHISPLVSRRLLRQYQETGSFTWTRMLEVGTDGFRYRKEKFLGLSGWIGLPFAQYHDFTLNQGVFYLFSKEAEEPVFTCPVSAPNFFPGLHALLAILAPAKAASTQDS